MKPDYIKRQQDYDDSNFTSIRYIDIVTPHEVRL